jgi:hypothetical protein
MTPLNLPPFEYKLKQEEAKVFIFDATRKKYIVLTPEEWVRQHFIQYIINYLNYPKALIKVEGGLQYNRLKKRSDIVIFDHHGLPWMVIECKSPDQKINNQTLQQVSIYNSTLKAKYVALTNGLKHLCCVINHQDKLTTPLNQFPKFGDENVS